MMYSADVTVQLITRDIIGLTDSDVACCSTLALWLCLMAAKNALMCQNEISYGCSLRPKKALRAGLA